MKRLNEVESLQQVQHVKNMMNIRVTLHMQGSCSSSLSFGRVIRSSQRHRDTETNTQLSPRNLQQEARRFLTSFFPQVDS